MYVGSLAARMTTTEDGGVGVCGDMLAVVGKIPWHLTMQASVNEHSQLETDRVPKTATSEGLAASV